MQNNNPMVKTYIVVENDTIQKVFCTDEPTIPKVYSDNYSDIREVPTHIGIRSETPLCCYKDDWSFKSKEELEKLGYDEEGGKLPTEKEKAEAKAKKQKLEKLQENLRQLERKIRRNQNYVRLNFAPVAKSLAQNSYDKTKTFAEQRLDIARIEKQELENLKQQNKDFLDKLEQQTQKYEAELVKLEKELENETTNL